MRIYQAFLTLVAACFSFSGFVPLMRWARQRGRHVVILNYHRAATGDLRAHLCYLRRHYRIMPLDDALEELYTPTSQANGRRDRRTPLVLTFDDGYYDNYSHAAKFAAELHTPITLFLVPGSMETRQRFWWNEADALVRDARSKEVTLEKHTYLLARAEDRRALRLLIDSRLRFASAVTTRATFLAATRAALDVSPDSADDDPGALPFGWNEAHDLLANPFVTFGAHTMHHPILACLSDPAEAYEEIASCRVALERGLGRQITAFAYPVGKGEDISGQAVRAVQEVGYRWAVTTIPGYNTSATEPHLLRRISTDPDVPISVLAAQTVGVWHVLALSRLRHLFRLRRTASGRNPLPRALDTHDDFETTGRHLLEG
jgi:peptidoglycan/xylan/chitin deacetylase (PgdA/CDA1 family)